MSAGIPSNRAEVRRVLADGAGGPVHVPMLERHAAHLEQLPPGRSARDPEALARSLRTAQKLYSLVALTVGDGGEALSLAVRAAGPESGAALVTPPFSVEIEAMCRLRTVLSERAALVVTLPAPGRLARDGRVAPDVASRVLLDIIRAVGEHEPDAFILTGHDEDPDPVHDSLGSFYGAAVLRVGSRTTPGVDAWADLEPPTQPLDGAFLITTPAEIRPDIDPATVRVGLAASR
jgi:hypothetical protein